MLYHVDVFMPDHIRNAVPCGHIKLRYSVHAENEAISDRYAHRIHLTPVVDVDKCTLIEVSAIGNKVDKYVIRTYYNSEHDITYVIIPAGHGHGFVKTIWLNKRTDVHRTLNKNRYARP